MDDKLFLKSVSPAIFCMIAEQIIDNKQSILFSKSLQHFPSTAVNGQVCNMSLYIQCLDNSQLDFIACSYTEALLLCWQWGTKQRRWLF